MFHKAHKHSFIIWQVILFLIILLFFQRICPLIPYDGDDWYFAGSMRLPFPLWGVFNPSKVLPEVLEPLGGYIGAYIIYPFTGDYVGSISIAYGIIASIFVYLFLLSGFYFLKNRYKCTNSIGVACQLFLYASFFLLFKQKNTTSYYALWSRDANCFFNYTIPGLLNGTIVFIMASYENFLSEFEKWSSFKKGLLLAGFYFSIFSSIQLSIILVSYSVWLLFKQCFSKKPVFSIKRGILKGRLFLVPIVLWVISLIFEYNGRRASGVTDSVKLSFMESIYEVLQQYTNVYYFVNKLFLAVILAAFVFWIVFLVVKKSRADNELFFGTLFSFAITFIFLTLLYGKAGSDYAGRIDSTFAILFWILFIIVNSFYSVISKNRRIRSLVPLFLILCFSVAANLNGEYAVRYVNYKTAKSIDDYIIQQIVTADEKNLSSIEVKVPNHANESNWPHPYNMAQWLQNTLYSHNIIKRRIKIEIVPDDKVTYRFYNDSAESMEEFTDLESR